MYKGYDKTRFNYNAEREKVWQEVVNYLQRYINPQAVVLDLGSGYCSFINKIKASKKYALDKYINPEKYKHPEVITLFGGPNKLSEIRDNSVDVVFASNFFEHLSEKDMESYLKAIRKKLKPRGKLILLQPNFRFAYANYFDDYTHLKAWSDVSLADYLKSQNFEILLTKPKFLPFSMKSNLPKFRWLIWTYLRSPIKPFAKQMLMIVRPKV